MNNKNLPQPTVEYYLSALGDQLQDFDGDTGLRVAGATTDSRQVQRDFIFIAIRGAQKDGAEFADAAVAAGAHTIVADRELSIPGGVNRVIVKNAYVAAARLAEAAAGYPARNLKLVGVTGTNGKTTCAYLLRDIFACAGKRTGMIGTVQYQVGDEIVAAERTTPTPFELQSIFTRMRAAKTEVVVAEVSSHALHQRRPGTARFKGALFTNLTGDHCDYHLTMDNYFAAKQVLFSEYLRPTAPAVINIDDSYGRQLVNNLEEEGHGNIVTFGTDRAADYRIEKASAGLDGVQLRLRGPETWLLECESPVVGGFNIHNIAGAAVLARQLDIDDAAIARAISQFRGAPGRMEEVPVRSGVKAFVDYAHTDDALANVLEAVKALGPRRILLVFGCGGDRDRSKRPRMGAVAAEHADRLYVTSDNPRSEPVDEIIREIVDGIPDAADKVVLPDRRIAIKRAVEDAAEGDVVIVAGKGHETHQEIAGRKYPFDDREELRNMRCGRR